MKSRGVTRATKKAPPPDKRPRPVVSAEDAAEELRKVRDLLKRSWDYLEKQLEDALTEDGNSTEVRQLAKAFEAREERILRSVSVDVEEGPGSRFGKDAGRYDLGGNLEPGPAPEAEDHAGNAEGL